MKTTQHGEEGRLLSQSIAQQLKTVRAQKGLSLDKASVLTGVSKAMLGQIERQESSPTIATLWKIATGLACSFSSFLQQEGSNPNVSGDHFINDPNMAVKTLFAFDPIKRFEVFEITLTNGHTQISTAHQQGVTEHIHVLDGQLSILDQGRWARVSREDQYTLHADTEHGYRDECGLTRFLVVIHYPL